LGCWLLRQGRWWCACELRCILFLWCYSLLLEKKPNPIIFITLSVCCTWKKQECLPLPLLGINRNQELTLAAWSRVEFLLTSNANWTLLKLNASLRYKL
jgi:hypothetical protein